MTDFSFRKHFFGLTVATVALALVESQLTLWGEWRPVAFFSAYGAFHGIAICFALEVAKGTLKQILFVALVASASVAAPFFGIASVGLLLSTDVEGDLSFVLMFVTASIGGAATYWVLLRLFWFPLLSFRSFLLTVGFCAVVSPLAIFAAAAFKGFGASESLIAELIPTVAWWFAFSSSLFLWDRMRNRGQLLPQ